MNKVWHTNHKMPENATREQRIEWHAAHAKACACRPAPASIAREVKQVLARERH